MKLILLTKVNTPQPSTREGNPLTTGGILHEEAGKALSGPHLLMARSGDHKLTADLQVTKKLLWPITREGGGKVKPTFSWG